MEQVYIVFLLFAIVLIAAFFYLRRARARTDATPATNESAPARTEPARSETAASQEPPAEG